jgi:hypothetical protein
MKRSLGSHSNEHGNYEEAGISTGCGHSDMKALR